VMPADNGLIVFWGAAGGLSFLLGFLIGVQLTLCFLVRLDADVDVTELEFHVGNKVDTSDLRYDGECFWIVPSIDQEWRVSDLSADTPCFKHYHGIL
jgi:hypothetical protein